MGYAAARVAVRVRLHRFGAAARNACQIAGQRLTQAQRAGMLTALRSTAMAFDPRSLDELARKLAEAVSPGLSALKDDLEQNFKAVLQSGLTKLDLVTRQEFDIQSAVLRRSRERLEELEKRLAALEQGAKK
jgi:BMFP domain-containing protein YqiC